MTFGRGQVMGTNDSDRQWSIISRETVKCLKCGANVDLITRGSHETPSGRCGKCNTLHASPFDWRTNKSKVVIVPE